MAKKTFKGRAILPGKLAGKAAIITGGDSGIGRAAALALTDAGADVIAAARTTSELEALAEEVAAAWTSEKSGVELITEQRR